MKLSYIKMSGFRGFREPTEIEVPPGFAIISGRNGSGKSTVCDAFEFALTGTIRGSSDHKEKGESIRDYLWWRGLNSTTESHVEIGLLLSDGTEVMVRRSPRELTITPPTELSEFFILPESSLDNPIAQLCRTTILRDEEITKLSIDLRETERFEFVRAALGTADFSEAEKKAKRVAELLKGELDIAQREYELQRDRFAQLATRLSQARVDASRTSGLEEAEAILKEYVQNPPTDSISLSSLVVRTLTAERARIDALTRGYARLDELIKRRVQLTTTEYRSRLQELESTLKSAQEAAVRAKANANRLSEELVKMQEDSPRLGSLAQIYEHGSRVGLQDGQCPLCGTGQTETHFSAHLKEIRLALDSSNATLAALSRQNADAAEAASQLAGKVDQLNSEFDTLRRAETALHVDFERLDSDLRQFGFEVGSDPDGALQRLSIEIENVRMRANRVEGALGAIRASQAASQVVELERESAITKERITAAEKLLSRLTSVVREARDASLTIRRVQGELVDEQLAALTPLLVELYQRLRPHIDWQKMRYNLRGDVRRMLSLEVGSGLNPNFIFSSGQRRAAGLAFLLAIHLSRSWCKLKTLILDDPVQHVDDYRALHLTEVLAAVRRTGRQVICTVEDQALAELLTRRLRSDVDDNGALIQLAYESGRGAHVKQTRVINPLRRQVLVAG